MSKKAVDELLITLRRNSPCDHADINVSAALQAAADEIERLWGAIYERGESPMEQRVQIDPVEYLRTRYISVAEYNEAIRALLAREERE